ncbi:MAG: alcohol dehydrogenase catalytic domain-containing protein [Chloroflexi bacterium]|nr:alcohol dehydrogenase catalytic domain-containing protein [Chloroflexota bacterium]
MRVAMYYNNRDVRLQEMPVPQIGPGELLVKIVASGVCGSDVMEWYRREKAPRVLGHEVAGVITQAGEGVQKYKVGQRVCVIHHVPCNACHHCLSGHETVCDTLRSTNFDPGGFAEYIRAPALNVDRGVYPLPDSVSYEEGTFIEPLSCAVRGQRTARFQPGQCVLVIGSGIAGLLHIQLARALGAGRIIATDITEYRLRAARQFSADIVLSASEDVPARLREVNEGRLADLVIVCAGVAPAIAQGIQCVERGGTVLLFAPASPGLTFPLDVWPFWRDGINLTTSYAGAPADCAVALELIRSRRVHVREMITHRLGLAGTSQGFQIVAAAQDSIKVIIEPQR